MEEKLLKCLDSRVQLSRAFGRDMQQGTTGLSLWMLRTHGIHKDGRVDKQPARGAHE